MTNNVEEHYETLLAPIYSWMVGDFQKACRESSALLDEFKLPHGNGQTAIDLGCGHGVHSVPLAERGYKVVGVDSSRRLLGELEGNRGALPIETRHADLVQVAEEWPDHSLALAACMGDTLTHLSTRSAVESVFHNVARSLQKAGLFMVPFRDYASSELTGTERFIPVRSDDARIHTCYLEYHRDKVMVHDLVHTHIEGNWKTEVSAYSKLRLKPVDMIELAESCGLSLVSRRPIRGMLYFLFRR